MTPLIPALADSFHTDIDWRRNTVSRKTADDLFLFFKHHPLFNWVNANNGCEGRADAICVLLDEWNIPNYKGWAFSGAFLRNHIGALQQNWKYHVATGLAVEENEQVIDYVLDPATADSLKSIEEWATGITLFPHSYYVTLQSKWYIFPSKNIRKEEWNARNKQNRKWMIQCLAGINSLTAPGKAALCFNKPRLKNTALAFENLKQQKPDFLNF